MLAAHETRYGQALCCYFTICDEYIRLLEDTTFLSCDGQPWAHGFGLSRNTHSCESANESLPPSVEWSCCQKRSCSSNSLCPCVPADVRECGHARLVEKCSNGFSYRVVQPWNHALTPYNIETTNVRRQPFLRNQFRGHSLVKWRSIKFSSGLRLRSFVEFCPLSWWFIISCSLLELKAVW